MQWKSASFLKNNWNSEINSKTYRGIDEMKLCRKCHWTVTTRKYLASLHLTEDEEGTHCRSIFSQFQTVIKFERNRILIQNKLIPFILSTSIKNTHNKIIWLNESPESRWEKWQAFISYPGTWLHYLVFKIQRFMEDPSNIR